MTSLSCIQTLKEERRFCAWVYSLIPRPYHRPVFDCLQCAKTASNQKQEGLGTRLGLLILFPGSFLVPIRPVSPHTSFLSQTLSDISARLSLSNVSTSCLEMSSRCFSAMTFDLSSISSLALASFASNSTAYICTQKWMTS